jgi:hypothetical protein
MSEHAEERVSVVPLEQAPVTLFDAVVLAVRHPHDKRLYVSLRDVCAAIGVTHRSQQRRIENNALLQGGLARFRIQTAGGMQNQDFFQVDLVASWLQQINAARIKDETNRARLFHFQLYLAQETYAALARLSGWSEQSSAQIEDIDELGQFDTSLQSLSSRMDALETSQDKARHAYADLRALVHELRAELEAIKERVSHTTLSKQQRGALYHLVQAWAAALSQHNQALTYQSAIRACWLRLNRQFGVARYEDIPSAKYQQAVDFVRAAVRSDTGRDLDLPAQETMDL